MPSQCTTSVLPVCDQVCLLNVEDCTKVIEFIEGAAWYLESVFSDEECDALIEECSVYHADIQYGLSYCTKSCFDDDNMANRVQKKIIQAFDHYDPSKSYRSDALTIETEQFEMFKKELKLSEQFTMNQLKELSLIEQLRFIKYPSGGYIGPHTDGVRVCPKTFRATNLTMIVYLSDSETGETIFLRGDKSNPSSHCRVQPVKGSVLLFQHHLLHMGDGVGKEGKILLRGDIVV